jgi:hypothetical protein
MENTTHLFLAVRFNCNKCHDHPFERWTQDQYYHLAQYFAQVDLKKDEASGDRRIGGTAVEGAKPLFEIVSDKPDGGVPHDRTGKDVPPELPYTAGPPAPLRTPPAARNWPPGSPRLTTATCPQLRELSWGCLLGFCLSSRR